MNLKQRMASGGRAKSITGRPGRDPGDDWIVPDKDDWQVPEAASFSERFDTSGSAPSNVAPLAEGLRRTADDRLLEGKDVDPVSTFGKSMINTALFNAPRNIEAAIEHFSTGKPFSQSYDERKAVEEAAGRRHPWASGAGTVTGIGAGALLLPGWGGAATGTGRAAQAGATGAAYSGAAEALDTKDPVRAATAAALGFGLGAVTAPVAEKIVGVISDRLKKGKANTAFLNPDGSLTDDAIAAARSAGIEPDDLERVLINAYAKKFQERGASPATARDAAAEEFGIKLSPGQATGDFTRTKYEVDASKGGYGPFATKAARGFFDEQAAQTAAAKAKIGDEVAGTGLPVESVDDAMQLLRQSTRDEAAAQRANFQQLYKETFAEPGEFSDIAFRNVADRIKNTLTNREAPVIIDDVTTPIANRALADVEQHLSNLRIQNRADPFGAPDPSAIVGVNLKGIDQARKRLVAYYKAAKGGQNAADQRATRAVIDALDNEIEMAMATGLFSGSDDALKLLKEARGAYSRYRNTFSPQGAGDDAGRAMQKIVERDATGADIANMLYGKSAIGEKGSSVKIANRIKDIFGKDSDEWSAVKQGLWQRLTSKPEGVDDFGPQAISQRIFKFVNGDGADTARAVFSKDEIAKMRRFASALKNIVPPKDAVNWSGTAYTLAALQGAGLGGGGLYFGADPQTAAALAGLRLGGKLARDIARGRSASKYFAAGAPSTLPSSGAPGAKPAGVGAGLTLGQLF